MANRQQKDNFPGGLGLLAAMAYLCYKGLKRVDKHLREKTEKEPEEKK